MTWLSGWGWRPVCRPPARVCWRTCCPRTTCAAWSVTGPFSWRRTYACCRTAPSIPTLGWRWSGNPPTSLLVDGDGGLGYFPAHEGTRLLIEKAEAAGIAVLVTRNHGHFGAAGLYSRLTLEHDLLSFVTSGHQLELRPGDPVYAAAGGSPMSFSAPTADEPPLVLDFGAMHDLYEESPRDLLAEIAPGLVHRSIGLGMVCQSWGGLLAGVPLDPAQARRRWSGANQGSMVIAMRIDLFAEPLQFRKEMDAYARAVRALTPIRGATGSYLPGGPEAEAEADYRANGIPVGRDHQELLERAATDLGVSVPWGGASA